MLTKEALAFLHKFGWRGKAVHDAAFIAKWIKDYEAESEDGFPVSQYSQEYLKYLSLYEGFEFYVINYMGRGHGLAGSLDIRSLRGYFDFGMGEELDLRKLAGSNDIYPIGILDLTCINDKCRLWRQAKRLSNQNDASCTEYRYLFMATDNKIYSYGEGRIYRHANSMGDFFDRISQSTELCCINSHDNSFFD